MKPNARPPGTMAVRRRSACDHSLRPHFLSWLSSRAPLPVSGPRSVRAVERRSARVSARSLAGGKAQPSAPSSAASRAAQSATTSTSKRRNCRRSRTPGGPRTASWWTSSLPSCSAPTARSSSPPRWSRSRNSATSSSNTPMIAFASRGIRTRRDPPRTTSSCRCIARWRSATCLRPAASTRVKCSSKARERRGPSPTTRLLKGAPRTDASSSTSTFRSARERPQPVVVFAPSFRTQSCLDRSQQRFLAEGFEQVIHRAAPQGSQPQFLISMCGDEDDPHLGMAGNEMALQFEPAHSRHAHIEDQAVRLARTIGAQELLGRSKYFHHELDGPEQGPKGLADGVVVVDDRDERYLRHLETFALALYDRRSAKKIHYTLV